MCEFTINHSLLPMPNNIQLYFENDKKITLPAEDLSKPILVISLENGIPHVHECGGNAECSTCRCLVLDGLENLLPRNEKESELAAKKGFPDNVRLACQTKVTGPARLRRLVLDDDDVEIAEATHSIKSSGVVKDIAIMFTDIRGFTSLSEKYLAYDVVHILNKYFKKMGNAVVQHNGYIDKYIGDGLMVLFGLEKRGAQSTCLAAVNAGLQMLNELDHLNKYLQQHFDTQLKIGIGIHFGKVILGNIGHPDKMQYTAIGDAVNMASRIETATKKAGKPFLISQSLFEMINGQVAVGHPIEMVLPGKSDTHLLYPVKGLL